MSTRQESRTPLGAPARRGPLERSATLRASGVRDPAEAVALVVRARRELLLGVHRHRLRREDLEDCYSQATLEILTRAQSRGGFASGAHIANALEQRFLSRVFDRRRQLAGRSPIEAACAHALSLSPGDTREVDPADGRADVERAVFAREELRRIAELSRELTPDQRLLLSHRLSGDATTTDLDFCLIQGWSIDKYHKVSQRTRAQLRRRLDQEPASGLR